MVLSLLQNEADAEDAAQQAFLNAFRNLSKFRAESRFSTWLIRIALNEARSKLRQKKAISLEASERTKSRNIWNTVRFALQFWIQLEIV